MENKNKQDSGSEMSEDQLHEHHSFKADPGQEPLRVDKYLMNRIENATRNKIQQAAKTDSIEDSIDYKAICKAVIKFVEESSFQLQESLAEGIASLVKDEFKVESIKLRVSKPGALRGSKDVGLIIHRFTL